MSIAFQCPCGQKLRAKPEMAGRQTRCPKCSKVVDIPLQPQSAPQIDTGQPQQSKAGSAPLIDTGQAPQQPVTPQQPVAPQQPVPVQPVQQPVAQPQPTPVPVQPVQQFVEMVVPCSCGASFQVSSQFAGQQVNCPTCGIPCLIPQQPTQQPVVTPVQQPVVSAGTPQSNPFESPTAPVGPAPKPVSLQREFSKVQLGALIAAISLCVFAGAYLLNFIGQGLAQIAVIIGFASYSVPPERPNRGDFSTRESYNIEMEKYQKKLKRWQDKRPSAEKLRKRAKTIRNLGKVADVFYKIGHVVVVISMVGCVVGFVFSFLVPTRKSLMGVAISMTAACALASIFVLIFQMIPMLDDGISDYRGHTRYIFEWFLEADFGDAFIAGLIDTMLFAPFILCGVFLMLAGKSLNRKDISSSGMISLWLMGGFMIYLVILYVMALIDFDLKPPAMIPIILVWFFQWAANIALGVGLFFLIRGFFKLKFLKLSGGTQQKSFSNHAFR